MYFHGFSDTLEQPLTLNTPKKLTTMRIYYLEKPLTPNELRNVSCLLDCEDLEMVRIPYVLPAPGKGGTYEGRSTIDDAAAIPPLKRAGILNDIGRQVGFVAPTNVHWYASFSFGIQMLTGYHPLLIQTPDFLARMNNPGRLRVTNLEGLVGLLHNR